MDVLGVSYAMHTKQGAAAAPAKKNASNGLPVAIAVLSVTLGAGYLSYTSNVLIDKALARVNQHAIAGGFVNGMKAVSAGLSGVTYLIYYVVFKLHRVAALRASMI